VPGLGGAAVPDERFALILRGAHAALEHHRQRVLRIGIAAARGGSLEMLRLLVESGADVAAGVPGDANPLILAVRNGDRPMVEYLLAHGANPSADVPGDENALVAAAESGDRDMMRLLMNDGRGD